MDSDKKGHTEYLRSYKLFFWKVIKKPISWVGYPFLGHDIYKLFFPSPLPASGQGGVALPLGWGIAIFALMLLLAGGHAYHELLTEKGALAVKLDDTASKERLLDNIEQLYIGGSTLFSKHIQDEEEYKQWEKENEGWVNLTQAFIHYYISKKEAKRFEVALHSPANFEDKYNESHNKELCFLKRRLEILEEIQDTIS